MHYILLNFAYGFGPPLRTTEVALSVGAKLKEKTGKTYGVIVPLVYADAQYAIMRDHFAHIIERDPHAIVLDANLGKMLKEVFYGDKSYEESLQHLLRHGNAIQNRIHKYLAEGLQTETLTGKAVPIDRRDIVMQISRNPRIHIDVRPSYCISFAPTSRILAHAIEEGIGTFESSVLEHVLPLFVDIEKEQDLYFVAEPATLFHKKDRAANTPHIQQVKTPPTIHFQPHNAAPLKTEGIYTTVTGIPKLERLYHEAQKLGLTLYSNKPDIIPGSTKATPSILEDKKIVLHFARSGWGSMWLSLITGVPFVTPAYDSLDDPEIYFNNACIETLGIGTVYANHTLEELLKHSQAQSQKVTELKEFLMHKYATLDGVDYTAEKIALHHLKLV